MASVGSPITPARRAGRPRSERRSADVLAAALDEIARHGISGLAIERVAARAGVSKVTVYRRWPDKVALALAALEDLPQLTTPDTGTLDADLRALRTQLVQAVAESSLGDVLPALMAERRRSDHRDAITDYIDRRYEPFRVIVQRALDRGEIVTDLPVELVTALFSSPLAMSIMNRDTPLDDREWQAVITTIVAGLGQPTPRRSTTKTRVSPPLMTPPAPRSP